MPILANFLLLYCSLIALSGCSERLKLELGKPYTLDLRPPPGTPEYQQGWSDGCQSALSGYGTQFNKLFFDFQQDSTQVLEPTYQQVWHDAYEYCRIYSKTARMHGYSNFSSQGMF